MSQILQLSLFPAAFSSRASSSFQPQEQASQRKKPQGHKHGRGQEQPIPRSKRGQPIPRQPRKNTSVSHRAQLNGTEAASRPTGRSVEAQAQQKQKAAGGQVQPLEGSLPPASDSQRTAGGYGGSPREEPERLPTMADIYAVGEKRGVTLKLSTIGPFFRITATDREDKRLGRLEGVLRPWLGGLLLHLDSVRLEPRRAGGASERTIFGAGLLLGALAVAWGAREGAERVELLAIDDSNGYLHKLVRYYTRLGFHVVGEVAGGSLEDMQHMLVWGGVGTKMEARTRDLLHKWRKNFTV